MRTTEEVTKFADERGVSIRTAYRWVKRFREKEAAEAQGKKYKPVPFTKPADPYEFSKGEWV